MQDIYIVINRHQGTNWKVGAKVKRITDWSFGDFPCAIFTDAENPGAAISAGKTEVKKITKKI